MQVMAQSSIQGVGELAATLRVQVNGKIRGGVGNLPIAMNAYAALAKCVVPQHSSVADVCTKNSGHTVRMRHNVRHAKEC